MLGVMVQTLNFSHNALSRYTRHENKDIYISMAPMAISKALTSVFSLTEVWCSVAHRPRSLTLSTQRPH